MHWKQWPVGGKSTVTIRFFLFVAVLLCVPSGPAFVKGDLVRHVLAADQPLWPHEKSDLKPDPELVFGRLDNGFRYVLLRNEQPEGRVSMHLNVQAGSVHEKENERGLAHFLEHMLFCGSEHFKPGELVEYLQSIGMAFGADANAHTGFYETVYDIFLPDGGRDSLAKGLLIMWDYAQGALLLPSEIDREREVVLAEMRSRDSTDYRTFAATLAFELPGARLPDRLPIGIESVLKTAGRDRLKAFYDAWYRPETTILIAVGDFDVRTAASMIEERFAGFAARVPARAEVPFEMTPHKGIKPFYHYEKEAGQTSVSLEVITALGPRPDTLALRKEAVCRELADQIVQNRLDAVIGKPGVPATSAVVGSGVYLNQVVYGAVSAEGDGEKWRALLNLVERHIRQALRYGFTEAELARVKKERLARMEQAVKTQPTRDSRALARRIIRDLNDDRVFLSPQQALDLFGDYINDLRLENVHAALKQTWSPDHRLILTTGDADLTAAEQQPSSLILSAYHQSRSQTVEPPAAAHPAVFPYLPAPEDTGRIIRRTTPPQTDIVQIDYANGVRLNLKKTDFKADEIIAGLSFGGGRSAEPSAHPGLAELGAALINESGLGGLERAGLEEALAGKHTRVAFEAAPARFVISAETTPDELALMFQLLYHYVKDPGFTPDAFQLVMNRYRNRYEALSHTIDGMMTLSGRRFLAGGDSRFGLPPYERFAALTLDDARGWMGAQLHQAPLELSLVGDLDIAAAVSLASRYFGGLPAGLDPAKDDSRSGPEFPEGGTLEETVDTEIPSALVVVAYPTDDIWDIRRTRRLDVLADVFSDRLRVNIREKLGAAYSPFAYNRASEAYDGYGTFLVFVEVQPEKAGFVVKEIRKMAAELAENGVTPAEVERSLKPTLNRIRDMRRQNTYWLKTVLIGSGKHPEKIDWSQSILDDYGAITTSDVAAAARRYLVNAHAAVIIARPAAGQ